MEAQPLPPFKGSASKAFKDVLASPEWVGNVLWLTLCALAATVLVGYVAILGYGAEVLERRSGRPENPALDIDSNRLGDYLEKGIWPFLVAAVIHVGLSIVVMIPAMLLTMIGMAAGSASGGDTGVMIGLVVASPLLMLLSLATYIVSVPFLIRGMVSQDFATSFDFGWAMHFLKVMFGELLSSGIAFVLLSLGVGLLGLLLCGIGYFPALGIIMGASINLMAQWYEIFLSRGGIPVPSKDADIIEATII